MNKDTKVTYISTQEEEEAWAALEQTITIKTPLSQFKQVGEFRSKMGLPISETPHFLSGNEAMYFSRFILEELSEFMKANEEGSLVDAADALVDLVYVAMGMAHAMGLPFDDLFPIVHKANMAKQPANDAIRSMRGSQYDVVKPIGWEPPEPMLLAIIQTAQKKNA